jgi:hypothetical protein
MMPGHFTSLAQCEFGDWVGIGVLVATGLFTVAFLGFGTALLARCLFESSRRNRAGTTRLTEPT